MSMVNIAAEVFTRQIIVGYGSSTVTFASGKILVHGGRIMRRHRWIECVKRYASSRQNQVVLYFNVPYAVHSPPLLSINKADRRVVAMQFLVGETFGESIFMLRLTPILKIPVIYNELEKSFYDATLFKFMSDIF